MFVPEAIAELEEWRVLIGLAWVTCFSLQSTFIKGNKAEAVPPKHRWSTITRRKGY